MRPVQLLPVVTTLVGTIVDIESGDAVSYVDIVNVVNTNIINSTGLIEFIKNVLGHSDFDLRDLFLSLFDPTNAVSTVSCIEEVCGESSLLIDLVNEAMIDNNITVVADTGSNSTNGTSSTVSTGDAYATANIINLVNTNIIDSNYLLLVFDNYSDSTGSLILPNSDFFTSLFGTSSSGNEGNFMFTNNATVDNQIGSVADTGSNSTYGTSSTVSTVRPTPVAMLKIK
jgi:hypothetical protein